MRGRLAAVGFVVGLLLVAPGRAQKATEIFIPIGASPGVSGKTSLIGTIEQVDRDGRILMVRDSSGAHRIELTDETRIWLDRSEQGQTNRRGSPADCRAGLRCEVKFVYDGEVRTTRAEWIKIRPRD